jgi:diguanylate cyclase
MSEISQSSEVAREALLRLAVRRLPPTPENYRALYHEIAGTGDAEPFPERTLKDLVARLPRTTPLQVRYVRQIEDAVAGHDLTAVGAALAAVLAAKEPPAWTALIRDLVDQLPRRHAVLTTARKREALEHVLTASSSDSDQLYARLKALLRSWSQVSTTGGNPLTAAVAPLPSAPPPEIGHATAASAAALTAPAASASSVDLRGLIADLLEHSVGVLVVESPELSREVQTLAAEIRAAQDNGALCDFAERLKRLAARVQWVAGDQEEIKAALLHLLQLIVDNIRELVVDDQWLQGQLAMVTEAFAPPLHVRRLEDVERRLKEVISKQSTLKQGLNEAKERIKSMLASFVDHLASMSESTSEYHDKIERCAARITSAKDISELSSVIDEVMHETRVMQGSAAHSRDELRVMKDRVDDSDKEIARLQSELAQTSKMVRHDQLTGALNRKGLDEALEREVTRSSRHASPLCVALLDIDNFKALNDTYGHATGDDALVHLARVIREALRPHDTLARYGGEEFVVILPETEIEDALSALKRLQREITKRFFLHDNDRILITFSAGVTQVVPSEDRNQIIARADAAMYSAKRAGKNRVVAN